MRLLGSRKFIDLPAGTLYTEHWFNDEYQCYKMIDEFKSYPEKFMDTIDLLIYQNNEASLCMEGQEHEDKVILTDINVVGDADPRITLRIVFDIDELPDIMMIRGSNYDDRIIWTKKELKKIIKEVVNGEEDRDHTWAHRELERLYKNGNKIIDIDL
jgi:hypothetical protein